MRLTQGAFSFLPDLTDPEIEAQIGYCLGRGWAVGIEHTDDPHPRNTYWEMFAPPLFDQHDAHAIMVQLDECRRSFPNQYIRVIAFDSMRGRETIGLSFIAHRPASEPGFHLIREEGPGRTIRYTLRSYAVDARPEGGRYA